MGRPLKRLSSNEDFQLHKEDFGAGTFIALLLDQNTSQVIGRQRIIFQ